MSRFGWGLGFDLGDFFGGPGARRHGPRRGSFRGGEVRLALLSLLDQAPGHGYDLMKRLEERSGGMYQASAGTVYPVLQRLEDEGDAARGAGRGPAGADRGGSGLDHAAPGGARLPEAALSGGGAANRLKLARPAGRAYFYGIRDRRPGRNPRGAGALA